MGDSKTLVSVEFEIFGKVQGVFFRKHTQEKAKNLRLTGYCRNTSRGTVQGVIEGEVNKISEMKKWLRETGSPQSSIESAQFTNEREITALQSNSFVIKR